MNTSKPRFKLVIGLGNPDKEYGNTYHNVGHLFVDYLQKDNRQQTANYRLLKSDVYMNESGKFVAKEMKKNGVNLEEILVVHDDSDIPLGGHKLSFGRGAAGHHGAESVIKSLKTKSFWRLRIGIRPREEKIKQKAEKFVLKKISAQNKKLLEKTFAEISGKIFAA